MGIAKPDSQASPVYPVTIRAVVLGGASVALVAAINPYLDFVKHTWSVGGGSLLEGPLIVLFAGLLVNGLLLRTAPRRALRRGELLVVYGMLALSLGLTRQGGLPYLVSSVTYPFYMAGPGNDWEHLILPHIPPWLHPAKLELMRWFWEGSPQGYGVPWRDWLTPMAAWGAFTFALMAAMFCLGTLLRKDWIERQRLTFPLVDVPLAVTGDGERPTLAGSIFANRVFWLGFSLPAALAVLGWLHQLYPMVPVPQIYDVQVGRSFAGMPLPWSVLGNLSVSIVFPVIGITCLLPSEVSLSLWLFYVLYRVQQLIWGSFGLAQEGATSPININPRAFIGFEEAGGFLALTALTLYQSRNALRVAWRSLIGRGRVEEPDPYSMLQGRWALLGFGLANGFMIWWAVSAGTSWWSFVGLFGVFYAVLVGASRMVAAGGVMFVDTGFHPRAVMLRTVGAAPIGVNSLTMYAYFSVIFMCDPMNLAMPQMMNSFKLVHSGRLRGAAFTWAAAVAFVAVIVFGISALLQMLHTYGAASVGYRGWPFSDYPEGAFTELATSLRVPESPDNWLRAALGLGAGFTLLLVWLNSRFIWWPVSPIGFLIASSWETNRSIWSSAFIAWVVSTLIRRYGGLRLFRSFRPAFLGLVLGDVVPRGVLAILSAIFGISDTGG
ncbi:MAG: DUF6785 family protein [Armatimonadota bacterium]